MHIVPPLNILGRSGKGPSSFLEMANQWMIDQKDSWALDAKTLQKNAWLLIFCWLRGVWPSYKGPALWDFGIYDELYFFAETR